ncbi:MAG: DUF1570 domain-containing protein [Planctomycetia bacterium]|nr:DUF1570 domain-containing protein [Planctomycetia bacterium]
MIRILRLGFVTIFWIMVGAGATPGPDDGASHAMDQVEFTVDERRIVGEGRILIEDTEGGVLLETTDGRRYIVNAENILSRKTDDRPFQVDEPEEAAQKVLRELPDGFRIHQTSHYTIISNTTNDYARWCGGVLEQLYRAFNTFWNGKYVDITEPEFPLQVVIFSDRGQYIHATRNELGEAGASVLGFYSMTTNRITTFDAANTLAMTDRRGRLNVRQIASMPGMSENVRNLVHEATHQLAFNRGLMHRFYDTPRWYAEGMACFFEVPDPGSNKGWGSLGEPNPLRIRQFASMIARRSDGTLRLLENDDALLMSDTAIDAYAEAYSIFFYLIKQRSPQLKKYIGRVLARQESGAMEATSAERLEDFESAFGPQQKFQDDLRKYWIRFHQE